MNSLVEFLNHSGDAFLKFAGSLLWQSSLLIVVVIVLDFALRQKARAAFRYSLWLVVLLKLLLPPTFALPTGIAWWLLPKPVTEPPPTKKVIVTYSQTLPQFTPANVSAVELPPPKVRLSAAGWSVIILGIVTAGLFGWMMWRWRAVARMIHNASPANESLQELLDQSRRDVKLKLRPRVRLTDQAISPAVCGLFRPVILLPPALAQQLSTSQLRAVLIHELVHLKRGDVWVNFAQSLLQIVYWWHPLLWFANARIRRVREEAVDDAVMHALRGEAENYAPTLLEVAKLALNRPLVALGLVGIMESRGALRERIERLIDFSASRRSGMTLLSFLGILGFALTAVPMGEPPSRPENTEARSPLDPSLEQSPEPASHPEKIDSKTGEELANAQRLVPNMEMLLQQLSVLSPTELRQVLSRVRPDAQLSKLLSQQDLLEEQLARARIDFAPSHPEYKHLTAQLAVLDEKIDQSVKGIMTALSNQLHTAKAASKAPPQVSIKAYFAEINVTNANSIRFDSSFGNFTIMTNTTGFSVSGGFTEHQFERVRRNLRERYDVKLLNSPQIITPSGRQAQIQVVDLNTVGTGTTGLLTNNHKTDLVPIGATLDVIPYVSADGFTIQMTLFLTVLADDEKETIARSDPNVPLPLPRLRSRQTATTAILLDGQTLMLTNFADDAVTSHPDSETKDKRRLIVFLTATIVDPTGKRVNDPASIPAPR